ncbi:MAG: EamA family transporter [Ottowia sp.]
MALLAAYGLSISFGQFALMFMAIAQGMPTGLAALLHQAQVFFTVLMAAWWLGEPVRRHQALGMGLAALGLGLIGAGQYRGRCP